MASQPIVRPATLEDLPILKSFEQGIIAAERPYDHTLKPDPISYYDLRKLIESPEAEVAVVEQDGIILASGYAKISLSRAYIKHEKHAALGFMYVADSARGLGYNHMIIEHLKDWTKARGLTEIRLTVYPGNAPAVRAYEKAGFTPYITEMRLNLEE